MPVNYHNNKEGNKWWCQKGATRFLKQWGQKSIFFFRPLQCHWRKCSFMWLRPHSAFTNGFYSALRLATIYELWWWWRSFFSFFFPNRMRRSSFARNLSLITNSPYSCTKANNKAEHSNHWAHGNTPMHASTQPNTSTGMDEVPPSSNLNFMSDWVSWWISEGPRFLRDGI